MGILLTAYGICKSLFGYKMYRVSCFFMGVLIGLVLGISLHNVFFAIILSISLGVASVCFLRLGIFIVGFVCGFLLIIVPTLVQIAVQYANVDGIIEIATQLLQNGNFKVDISKELLIASAVGLFIGLIGLIFTKVVLIIMTAAMGAVFSGIGIYVLGIGDESSIAIIAIVLSIIGVIFQFYTNRKKTKEGKKL